MPNRFSIGSIDLTASNSIPASPAARPRDDMPFRMLVMGNFRGPTAASRNPTQPLRVDLDNQDAILEKLDVSVNVPSHDPSAEPISLRFRSMDDFHPDQWIRQIPWFNNLLDWRRQLDNPATFAAAAGQLGPWIDLDADDRTAPALPPSSPASPASGSRESNDDMLERLLGKPGSGQAHASAAANPAESAVQHLIQQAVGSSGVPGADPRQAGVAAAADRALARRLNAVLHDPGFQAVEAAWRGMDYLIKNVELDENLQLFILDLSRDELLQDLGAAADLTSTRFFQNIIAPTMHDRDALPWAVWVGQYEFSLLPEDLSLLAAIGQWAAAAGTPFLAGMRASILDELESSDPSAPSEALRAWNALRQLPGADYLGLSLPRFLARLPYGPKTDPIECFDFTEIPGAPRTRDYLWNNSAIACACLLGQSFSQCGWNLSSSILNELEGLPLHVYEEDGESKMTPCAEIWLNDLNSDTLLDHGLIPLQSIQRRDAVRLPRFQSIRRPPAALAGRWS